MEGESDAEQRDAGLGLYTVSKHGGGESECPPGIIKAYSFTFIPPTDSGNLATTAPGA